MQLHLRALTATALCALAALAASIALPAPADAGLLAKRSECRGQQNTKAPEPRQEQGMRCLIRHARKFADAGGVGSHASLERAAGEKARDVFRCGFSHTACGRPADLWPRRFGYTSGTGSWRLGENLAWGKRKEGSARRAFKVWLHSPAHRATMLTGSFEHSGIGLKRGRFAGHDKAAVWVLELGCRGCG